MVSMVHDIGVFGLLEWFTTFKCVWFLLGWMEGYSSCRVRSHFVLHSLLNTPSGEVLHVCQ
jgi:hypothetical protein